MKPQMTGQQAEALAGFLVSLRPGQGRWTKRSVFDALTAAAIITNDTEALARAAIRAALTASIVDPCVIAMRGAHWESVDHSPTNEPVRARPCIKCGDWVPAGVHPDDFPCAGPRRITDASEHARRLRAELKPCKAPDLEADKAKAATESETP